MIVEPRAICHCGIFIVKILCPMYNIFMHKQRGYIQKKILFVLFIPVILLCGCHSMPMVETAHTLEPGKTSIILMGSYYKDDILYGLADKPFAIPQAGIGIRWGVGNGMETGFSAELPIILCGDIKFKLFENDLMAMAFDTDVSTALLSVYAGGMLIYTLDVSRDIDVTLTCG